MCHEDSEINFNFNSALILGKVNDNYGLSNGSGKSSIFNAIEFVLFNDFPDLKMEKVIRDGSNNLSILFDFNIDGSIYRIERNRPRSGTPSCEVKQFTGLEYEPGSLDWKNISGRRNSDSENQIKKIIKINQNSFRNSVHFVQNDFSGLTNASSGEKRKLLKQIFDLSVYSKLEKMSKAKEANISKSMIKSNLIIDELDDVNNSLIESTSMLPKLEESNKSISGLINSSSKIIDDIKSNLKELNVYKKKIISDYPVLSSSLTKEKANLAVMQGELANVKNYVFSYNKNIENINNNIGTLSAELPPNPNSSNDLNQIKSSINSLNELRVQKQADLRHLKQECVTLEQATSLSECDRCLQEMSKDHCERITLSLAYNKNKIVELDSELKEISEKINQESIKEKQVLKLIDNYNSIVKKLEALDKDLAKNVSGLELNKSKLESILEKINTSISVIDKLSKEIDNVDLSKSKEIDLSIKEVEAKLNKELEVFADLNKQLQSNSNDIAIHKYNIKACKDKISNINIEKKALEVLNKDYQDYQDLTNAFSSKGIPSLLINNLLTKIEDKANSYLSRIKPGLEILFSLSKENSDGEEVEDFDIKYFYNNQEREFAQMSGAMKFCATFALKLSLSTFVQETLNTNIKFLLFDEIDQSLDENSSNEFVNLVKELEKEYKILVITHNKRLKDKFSDLIIVNQDENMVSKVSQL